jgi:hypothetical protein
VRSNKKIIVACMALHNFIRDHDLYFELDVQDTSYAGSQPSIDEGTVSGYQTDMGDLRDAAKVA